MEEQKRGTPEQHSRGKVGLAKQTSQRVNYQNNIGDSSRHSQVMGSKAKSLMRDVVRFFRPLKKTLTDHDTSFQSSVLEHRTVKPMEGRAALGVDSLISMPPRGVPVSENLRHPSQDVQHSQPRVGLVHYIVRRVC